MQAVARSGRIPSAAWLLLAGPGSADHSLEERRVADLAVASLSTCYFEAAARLGADLINDRSDCRGAKF